MADFSALHAGTPALEGRGPGRGAMGRVRSVCPASDGGASYPPLAAGVSCEANASLGEINKTKINEGTRREGG